MFVYVDCKRIHDTGFMIVMTVYLSLNINIGYVCLTVMTYDKNYVFWNKYTACEYKDK